MFSLSVPNLSNLILSIILNDSYLFYSSLKKDDINLSKYPGGLTPLHVALLQQRPLMFDTLIELKADVNLPDNTGRTVIFEAVRRGKLEIVKKLIKKSATVNFRDKYGNTPLHVAASMENFDIVLELLKNGANPHLLNSVNETPIYIVMNNDRTKVINTKLAIALISNGESVNYVYKRNITLLYLAMNYDIEIATKLLEYGALPNVQNSLGLTPLMIATKLRKVNHVRLLLSYGADTNIKDSYGRTAMHFAVETLNPNKKIVSDLLENKADIYIKDRLGNTPAEKLRFLNRF